LRSNAAQRHPGLATAGNGRTGDIRLLSACPSEARRRSPVSAA
jgi:hypothetical protein